MQGKVCIITGANSGIGKETALGLAKMGATVVLVCHNKSAGTDAMERIKVESANDNIALLLADLFSQAAIRQLAHDFQAQCKQLHVLINNAGIAPIKRSLTGDGIETAFAVNYLAPYLLTNLLLDVLKKSAPSRVVNVAGDFHRKTTINFDDLMSVKNYTGTQASNQAKLALILFPYVINAHFNLTVFHRIAKFVIQTHAIHNRELCLLVWMGSNSVKFTRYNA